MHQSVVTSQDKKDLDKFGKFLCLKSAQVIVQGRLGKPISSRCSPQPTGAEWFNLAIKDYPEIQRESKNALLDGNPKPDSSFVVEISLRTSDSESMILEIWSLSFTKKCEYVRVHHTVYNRMSLLLKSLMCITRATPAYKLSCTQGSEYVVCFRIYMGKVDITELGQGVKTLKIGSVSTPIGTFILSAAYRTSENLHVSTRKLVPGTGGPMQLSQDYFCSPVNVPVSPAKPCHTLKSRLMSHGELDSSTNPVRESPSYRFMPTSFTTSPNEIFSDVLQHYQSQQAMFTIGTPPSQSNTSFASSSLPSNHRRKSEGMTYEESSRQQFIKPSMGSSRCSNIQSLADNRNVFKPISESEATLKDYPVKPLPSEQEKDIGFCRDSKVVIDNTVTITKLTSSSNATVGFPENTESSRSHASSITSSSAGKSCSRKQKLTKQMAIPSPGAFVLSSKTAARAYKILGGISDDNKLPFQDLLGQCETKKSNSETSHKNKKKEEGVYGSSGSDTSPESDKDGSTITRLSSQSSLSSHHSSEPSRSHTDRSSSNFSDFDEFVMVDLKPAFGKNDSSSDLGTFYRECENAPELIMFEENNGTETQEALLDLTKHLEDYERDGQDFDSFVEELLSSP